MRRPVAESTGKLSWTISADGHKPLLRTQVSVRLVDHKKLIIKLYKWILCSLLLFHWVLAGGCGRQGNQTKARCPTPVWGGDTCCFSVFFLKPWFSVSSFPGSLAWPVLDEQKPNLLTWFHNQTRLDPRWTTSLFLLSVAAMAWQKRI